MALQITDKDIPKKNGLLIKGGVIVIATLASWLIIKDNQNRILYNRIEENKDIRAAELRKRDDYWQEKFDKAQFKYDSSLTRIRDQFNNYILDRANSIEKQGKKIDKRIK